MELTKPKQPCYYDGNETQIKLPHPQIIKNAILNLDFSAGAQKNQEVTKLLATQFCLSDEQKNAKLENGVNIWNQQVGGVIQELVRKKEIVRTMPKTIITPDALKNVIEHFLERLRYEHETVVVRDKDNDDCKAFIQILTKTEQGKGLTFTIEVSPR